METASQSSTSVGPTLPLRTARKDVGVGIVVVVSLLLGYLLFRVTDGRTKNFQSQDAPFRIAYPAAWVEAESLLEAPLLKVQDPRAGSAFKTSLTIETRELDPTSPPTAQTLLDRRVEQRSALTGYHFLSNRDADVGGEKAIEFNYAYVVQPIDQPRRASLPVVVQAREYIIVGKDRTYYITLAAPQNEFNAASAKFDQMIQSVQLK
jgi:hypothetical protein